MKRSWKTTTMGVTSIVVAVGGAVMALIDNDPATNPSWEALGAAIMAGVGLIFARDNTVTSTDLGLHKPVVTTTESKPT